MSKPTRDKQKELTAASLKRIAKALRKSAKAMGLKYCLPATAKALDAEAKLLRSMR